MGLKLVKNQKGSFRFGDTVRFLRTGIRGIGKVIKGLWVGVQWIVIALRSLWSVIRWIGRFFIGVLNLGRGIQKMFRVTKVRSDEFFGDGLKTKKQLRVTG